jgi:hypothetical protein
VAKIRMGYRGYGFSVVELIIATIESMVHEIDIDPCGRRTNMAIAIEGIKVPDGKLAREVKEPVHDTEPPLLFHHSIRLFYWGALTGAQRGLTFDAELRAL